MTLRAHLRRPSPRPCNLCGQSDALQFLYVRRGYRIVRCRSCSLRYVDQVPSRSELDAIYSAEFFTVGGKFTAPTSGPQRVNAMERIKRLQELPGVRRDRWLDVGCATGDFILAAAPVVSEIRGIEISAYAAGQARARGVSNVVVGDFLEADVGGEQFDLLSMWDVIEHVPDPLANVRKAFDLLKPGGYLVISTGDVASRVARLSGRFWHLMIPPKHLYFFSQTTIRRMLVACGFVSLSVAYPGKRVPVDFMLQKCAGMLWPEAGRQVLRMATRVGLGNVAPTVNLGDIMTLYARKPLAHVPVDRRAAVDEMPRIPDGGR